MNEVPETAPNQFGESELERRVSAIWCDVLGVAQAPADATFLELQGQSISAVRIVGRIEEELGVDVDAAVLFEDPDLRTFVNLVRRRAGGGS